MICGYELLRGAYVGFRKKAFARFSKLQSFADLGCYCFTEIGYFWEGGDCGGWRVETGNGWIVLQPCMRLLYFIQTDFHFSFLRGYK